MLDAPFQLLALGYFLLALAAFALLEAWIFVYKQTRRLYKLKRRIERRHARKLLEAKITQEGRVIDLTRERTKRR